MFTNLKLLYENELHANVLPIGNLLINMYNSDRSCLTPDQYLLSLMYYGNSLYAEGQHRRAEQIFGAALQAKKACLKHKPPLGATAFDAADEFSIGDIRCKLALCLEATGQTAEAVAHLQAIPVKQRTVRMNMLLAKLLQVAAYDKNAIQPLRAVLLQCPLNLDAIRGLLAVGVKAPEITALLTDAGLPAHCIADWLHAYIGAYAHMFAGRFGDALESLRVCESKPGVGDSEAILVLIGQCHHYMGNVDMALAYLKRAYNANNYMTEGLMSLAALYGSTGRLSELERLTLPTVAPAAYTAEYWFVLAQHLYAQGKYEKAAHFAQKSCFMRPKNVEAMLLRVKIFMQAKNYKEAIVHLRVLQQYADYRFEVHEALVEAFILTNRLADAQVVGRDVVRRHKGNLTARYYVLLVRPYLVQYEPQHRHRVKSLLLRALEKDEYHMPAALLLVSLMRQEGDRTGTAKLLKKQLAKQPNSKMYALLGDLLSEEKDQAKAVEYYTTAINLDPTNRKAVAGLIAMGQSLNPKTTAEQASTYGSQSSTDDDSVNFDNAAMTASAPGPTTESDDALWTDIEVEVNTS